MKITKAQLRKIIREAVDLDEPFMWKDEAYTVTERKPSRHKGVQNGKPMELVIWKTLKPSTGTPGMGSMDIPQGMGLEEFFEAGEKEGFPDYYKKPETGADMNKAIKAAEERGDWDDRRRNEGKQMKITKRQLRRIIRESLLLEHPYDEAYMAVENDQFGHLEGRTKHIKMMDNGRFLEFQLSQIDRSALSPEMQAKLDELLTGEWFWDRDYKSTVNLRKVPDEIKDLLADPNDPKQVQEYLKGGKAKREKRLAGYREQMEKDRLDIAAEKAAEFDAEINDSVDIGSLSNSDAVDEIQARLESMGEDALVDEIEKMIENDADDIVDVLEMIPDEIKAKLTK